MGLTFATFTAFAYCLYYVAATPFSLQKRDSYGFIGCTDVQEATLTSIFAQLKQDIDGWSGLLEEAANGTNSIHGYSTFFKADANKAHVIDIFSRINAEDKWQGPAREGQEANPTSDLQFLCVNENGAFQTEWEYWKQQNGIFTFPAAAPNSANGLPDIWVYPNFWSMVPIKYPYHGLCPVTDVSSLRDDDNLLSNTQYGWVINALAAKYLDSPPDSGVVSTKDCADLTAEQQLKNPGNYALFASCMFFFLTCPPCLHPLVDGFPVFADSSKRSKSNALVPREGFERWDKHQEPVKMRTETMITGEMAGLLGRLRLLEDATSFMNISLRL